MTPEKILELAAQNETGTFSERVWAFDEEALFAFARAVIEADREELVKTIMPKLIELAFLSGRNNSPVSKNEQNGILTELFKVWL